MVDGGWDECKNYTDVMTCPAGQDRCAKAKAEALVGNKTCSYHVKSCAFEKECKENDCSRMGAGRSPKTFFSALWVSFWSSSPSPRSATVIEVTLRQDLIKKKIHHYLSPFSSICFLGDLELLNKKKKRNTAVFKLDNKTYYPAKPQC